MTDVPAQTLIQKAADCLRRGGLVAFPTETVYGLGADASNPEAIARLYAAKGRPANHPVIVHLSRTEQLADWAQRIPPVAYTLAEAFWPGPMTLILPKADSVGDFVTGGQPSVGLRIPNHPVALSLLTEFGGGVAAPSANRFGRISPTSSRDVQNEFHGEIDMVLEGGACRVGIESTIIDLSQGRPRVLRPGMLPLEPLAEILAVDPEELSAGAVSVSVGPETRAPGTLVRHYAPKTPVQLLPTERLFQTVERLRLEGLRVGVLARREPIYGLIYTPWVAMPNTPADYAARLYSGLRELDVMGCDRILVETVPETPDWEAIRDRLQRASAAE
jgi:L-threonylcarbamoyladenylate synthase